jgi:hypothetical protein
MAVSPSAHPHTTPNAHPVAAGHLGDGSEAAGAANGAAQPPDSASELNINPWPTIPQPQLTLLAMISNVTSKIPQRMVPISN